MSGKKAVRVGDIGTDHDGFPATPVISGSPDVLIDGIPAARVGDPLAPHSKPKHPPHGRSIATGSTTVLINGRPAAVTGGSISCGGVTIGGGSVNIGDRYIPANGKGLFSPASALGPAEAGEGLRGGRASQVSPAGLEGGRDTSFLEDNDKRRKTLRIGLFFDGTGNNMYNDIQLPDRDITNIAKLYELYRESEEVKRIYIEGVGTTRGEMTVSGFDAPEPWLALSMGVGPEGGHGRVQYAVEEVRDALRDSPCERVVFDVFGFSRGAALARHFVNLIHRWPRMWSYPSKLAPIPAFPQSVTASVCFLGLFDTVGSFYAPGNDDDGDFNLNLSPESAQKVVQLTAYHEIRQNFPLTSIHGTNSQSAHFLEIPMPGVHSDIGGGYENPDHQRLINFERFTIRTLSGHGLNGEAIRSAQRQAEALDKQDARNIALRIQGADAIIEERRATRKELAVVSLREMYRFAEQAGVPLKRILPTDKHLSVPDELAQALGRWRSAGAELGRARDFLHGYMHTSHRDDSQDSLIDSLAHAPEPGGKRQIFLNRPERAIQPRESSRHA
ncbi:hypothetical protein GCM10009104_26450 [Marinobacterium maritimum]|uniref:T6SS Phospholipase effector Tle1-like catalytic domain-containing protein n=1 Tax=Marinobacterium maritimum TaxID=500162 RepID=A0ABP3TF39_9GAMM